jgi:hypothetical protein
MVALAWMAVIVCRLLMVFLAAMAKMAVMAGMAVLAVMAATAAMAAVPMVERCTSVAAVRKFCSVGLSAAEL